MVSPSRATLAARVLDVVEDGVTQQVIGSAVSLIDYRAPNADILVASMERVLGWNIRRQTTKDSTTVTFDVGEQRPW